MKKIIVLALSVVFLVGVFTVVAPVQAASLREIQNQIQSLLGQVKQLEAQNQGAAVVSAVADIATDTSESATAKWCFTFKNGLRKGDAGGQAANLHIALQKEGYAINIGEINNKRFGGHTKSAVIGFQEKYASEILTPIGETKGTGIVGNTTRAKLNQLYGCGKPSITITSPGGGEMFKAGSNVKVRWVSKNITADAMMVALHDTRAEAGVLAKTFVNGNPGGANILIPALTVPGKYNVVVANCVHIDEAPVCFDVRNPNPVISFSNPFSIVESGITPRPPTTSPSINVISPNGGEKWEVGSTQTISWKGPLGGYKFVLDLIGPDGKLIDGLGQDVFDEGINKYIWKIPEDLKTGDHIARVILCPKEKTDLWCSYVDKNEYGYDQSDAAFSIIERTTQQPVIVKSGTQPVATLAVENTIVPFTNFIIDPQGHSINSLGLTIQKNGIVSDAVFNEIVLIADYSPGINSINEKRIIARGKLDNGTTNLIPETLGEFSGVANFTVAGVMRDDLDNYSGQVVSLSVVGSSIRGETEGLLVDARFPITGASHTINSTLKVGDITVATPGGSISFDSLTISNSTIEKVLIEKLVVRSKNIGSVKIKETGETFQCQTLLASAIVGCNFYGVMAAGGIILDKGLTRTFEFQPQGNFDRVFVNDPLDSVVARGMTYNYQLVPRLGIIGGKPSITVVSPNGGEKWKLGGKYQVKFQQSNLSVQGKVSLIKQGQESGTACLLRYVEFGKNVDLLDVVLDVDLSQDCLNKYEFGDITPGSYKVNISAGWIADHFIQDSSDASFSIVEKGSGSGLTENQIDAIITLLQSFGANQFTIDKVNIVLNGGVVDTETTPSGLSETQINSILNLLRSFGVSQSRVDQVKTVLVGTKIPWCYDFNKNLRKGEKGKDVAALQTVLEKEGFAISQNEKANQRFGNSTGAAVIAFQEKYKDEILKTVNEREGTGFVGKTTRVKLNQLYGCKKEDGSLNVQKSYAVLAQNIAIGTHNQPLGGFSVEATSEPIAVSKIIFKMSITDNDGGGEVKGDDIDKITLFDENGRVVAGPVDAMGSGSIATVTLTDTVMFPVGAHTYILKGNLSNNFENNDTIIASTIPSTDWTGWPGPIGQITGKPITPSPSSTVYANKMSAKSGALAIGVSSVPVAQTILAGARATFANYNFDTTASSEDVRFPSIPLKLENTSNSFSGAPNNLTSCQLYDGNTALNTGINAIDPSGSATSTDAIPTFNFDSPLTVPKGIVKTLRLQCKVSATSPAGSKYQWGIGANPSIAVTGVTSGAEVTETVTASDGQIMTVEFNVAG